MVTQVKQDSTVALLATADMMRYRALKEEVSHDGGSELSEYDWLFKEHFEKELRLTQLDTQEVKHGHQV